MTNRSETVRKRLSDAALTADKEISGRKVDTRLALALATVLITNSHLEKFYPTPVLAGDGLLGNAIFFMVAGMGVTLSAKKKARPFPEYYWRRIIRIYPTVFIVVTAFMLLLAEQWRHWGWYDYVAAYLYPTPFAFVGEIMIFYVLLYPLLIAPSAKRFGGALLILVPVFVYCWVAHPQPGKLQLGSLDDSIYYIFWFEMVLLGGFFACAGVRFPGSLSCRLLVLAGLFALYVGLKFLFVTGRLVHWHIVLFPLVVLLVWAVTSLREEKAVFHALSAVPYGKRTVEWLGTHTLEIYTIQGFLAYRDDLAHGIAFPLNILLFLVILSALAWTVQRVAAVLRRDRHAQTIAS